MVNVSDYNKFSGLDGIRLLDLSLVTQWEVERGHNFVKRHWESTTSSVATADIISPIPRSKRNRLP